MNRVNSSLRYSMAAIIMALFLLLAGGCGTHVYHQVKKGDTLYSISWRYHQNYHDIARWNGIEAPYIIHAGQWLRVAPSAGKTKPPSAPPQVPVRDLSISSVPESKPSRSKSITPPKAAPVPAVQRQTKAVTAQTDSASVSAPDRVSVPASRAPVKWQWPVRGSLLENYHAKRPGKAGIAIAGVRGEAVRAAAAGKVVYSGDGLKGYGNLIIIMHNEKYLSAYGLNETLLVREGDFVDSGQEIATLGGKNSLQGELYFEIRIDGKPANPMRYLPKRGS